MYQLLASSSVVTVHIAPAFDVTPAELIPAIISERGVFKPSEIGERFSLS